MKRQPKRSKSRTKHSRLSPTGSGGSKEGEGAWIAAYPKTKTREADDDDILGLNRMMRERRSEEPRTRKKPSRKLSKKPKKSMFSWNDGCSSDDESGDGSDGSAQQAKKKGNKRKSPEKFNAKERAAQSVKRRGRKERGNCSSSDDESDGSVKEVRKRGNGKRSAQPNGQASNRRSKYKRQQEDDGSDCDSSGGSESDVSVGEVRGKGNCKRPGERPPNRVDIEKPTPKSSKRGSMRKSREDGDSSSRSSDGESDGSVEKVRRKDDGKKPRQKRLNRVNIKTSTGQSSKREGKCKIREGEGDSDSESDGTIEKVKKRGKPPKPDAGKATMQSSKRGIEQKSLEDGANSSSGSDSESDRSLEELTKKVNNKRCGKKPPNPDVENSTAQSSKRRSKHKSLEDDGNSSSDSDSESVGSVAEVKKKANNMKHSKRPLNHIDVQELKAQSNSRGSKYKSREDDDSSGGGSDGSVEEVKKRVNDKRPGKPGVRKATAQSSKRGKKYKSRGDDGNSSSGGGSESGGSVEGAKNRGNGQNPIEKPLNQIRHISRKAGDDSGIGSNVERDSSVEEVKTKGLGKRPGERPPNHIDIENPTAQSRKRGSKYKSLEDADGSSSSSSGSDDESDRSVEEVEKRGNDKRPDKKPLKQVNSKTSAAQSNKREINHESQKPKTINRTSFNKVSSAGLRKSNTPYNAPSRDITRLAETKVNRATMPEYITSVSQLQWYRIRLLQTEEGTRETLKPCRILSGGEAAKYLRDNSKSKTNGKATVIQYLTFPVDKGLHKCVDENSLIPFGYTSKDGLSTTFNDDYIQRYMRQEAKTTSASNLEATRLFLIRVFEHARDATRKSRDQANKDFEAYLDSSSDDDKDESDGPSRKVSDRKQVQFELVANADDDSDGADNNETEDLDVPYTQAITFDPDDFGKVMEQSNEPIRPGDVVEYYSPIFVAGDARGLRQATVLAVDPNNEETKLTLSNGEFIPSNTKVKRIKVMLEGELVDHPGIYRPIYRFKLVKKGTATAADAIAMEASRFGRIMQKNMNKLREKAQADGFAPMDMLVNIKGVNTDTSAGDPSRTKSPTTAPSRDKQAKPLLSSSSDESDGSSDCHNKKKKHKAEPQRKKTHEIYTHAAKVNDNKENNGNASSRGKRMSLGSLSSSASLGSSLATSDDSSIDSSYDKLGGSHKKTAQHVKSASSKCKKASTKPQDSAVTYDLSLSPDDDDITLPKGMGRDKRSTPPKVHSSSAQRSPNSRVNKESLLDSSDSPCSKNAPAFEKCSPASSVAASIGSSKRRLTLGSTPKNKRVASSSSSSKFGNNDKDGQISVRKAQCRRKPHPSHGSSGDTIASSDSLRRPKRRKEKVIADPTSTVLAPRRSSSSDSVQVVNGPVSSTMKKRPSPSSNLFSSDDSDDNQMHGSESKKPLRGEQLGWTQGKAGWEKKSKVGDSSSFGFSTIRRHK